MPSRTNKQHDIEIELSQDAEKDTPYAANLLPPNSAKLLGTTPRFANASASVTMKAASKPNSDRDIDGNRMQEVRSKISSKVGSGSERQTEFGVPSVHDINEGPKRVDELENMRADVHA